MTDSTLMEMIKAWQYASASNTHFENSNAFSEGIELLRKQNMPEEKITEIIDFFRSANIKEAPITVLDELCCSVFPNEMYEISAQKFREEDELKRELDRAEEEAISQRHKNLKLVKDKIEDEINNIYEQIDKKKKLVDKVEGDIHPTVLDSTVLLNKRNLLFTSSVILVLALIADGDLSNFRIFGLQAGELNPTGLWWALIAGLVYLFLYYIARIFHYRSMISENRTNIEAIDSANSSMTKSHSEISRLNSKAYDMKASLGISERNNHEPIADDDNPDISNPFKLNASRKRLFLVFDIWIPISLAVCALSAALYHIKTYEHIEKQDSEHSVVVSVS